MLCRHLRKSFVSVSLLPILPTLPYDVVLLYFCRSYVSISSQDRQTQNRDKRERLAAALESGQRIIIDLDFADLMTDQVTRLLQCSHR